ncbi:MAG: FKBP-type peptidyl-prolyl cis-trans isomerase [Clostridia bacterium]|nr:FKBP-type peptidyl-prolyl cis-trans isomerase [Clostridia bacterium]
MKTANKFTALALAALMAATLVACDKNSGTSGTYSYSEGLDENGFFEGIKASDIVTLPEYKGIDIDSGIPVATDEELDEQLSSVISSYSHYEEITDRAVVDGDTLNIDYVGSIDGVQFDGGNTGGLGTNVTIGVTNYIDGFLDQLIGHTPGETFDIVVTFPEDYGKEELNGKEAVFETTINYIQGDYIEAELTDDIAVDYGFTTADELVADIEDWIVSTDKFYFFTDLLAEATCDEVPQSVIDYLINYEKAMYESEAAMYGYTIDEYLSTVMGYESWDAYVEANADAYVADGTLYLAAQAIAELEGISVTDADIEAAGYTEYVEQYGKPYIKQFMLYQEILPQFVIDNGNLVDGLDDAE